MPKIKLYGLPVDELLSKSTPIGSDEEVPKKKKASPKPKAPPTESSSDAGEPSELTPAQKAAITREKKREDKLKAEKKVGILIFIYLFVILL